MLNTWGIIGCLFLLCGTTHAIVQCSFNQEDEANCRYHLLTSRIVQWQRLPITPITSDGEQDAAMVLHSNGIPGFALFEIMDVPIEESCLSFDVSLQHGGFYRVLSSDNIPLDSYLSLENNESGMHLQRVDVNDTDRVRFEGTLPGVASRVIIDNVIIQEGRCDDLFHDRAEPDPVDEDGPAVEDHSNGAMSDVESSLGHNNELEFIPHPPRPFEYPPRNPNDNFPPPPTPANGPQPQVPATSPEGDPLCPTLLRLTGGSTSHGRVELCHRGQWGSVCNDSWKESNTRVLCRTLGFIDGELIDVPPNLPELPIFVDGLRCRSYHQNLHQCCYNEIGVHDCQPDQDVAVSCNNIRETDSTQAPPGSSSTHHPPQGANDGTPWIPPPPNPVEGIEEPLPDQGFPTPDNSGNNPQPPPAPENPPSDSQDQYPPQGPSDGTPWYPPPPNPAVGIEEPVWSPNDADDSEDLSNSTLPIEN